MDLKIVSKNYVGALATLFLIILLSKSRILNFLIDTTLGRAILILFILGISYIHSIFGVVAVLFIIISLNNSDIGYMEGFTDSANCANCVKCANCPNCAAGEKNTDKKEDTKDDNKEDKKSSAIEGSNIVEREGTMLKGKRSNEVPVLSSAREQSDSVEPTYKTSFSGTFSLV